MSNGVGIITALSGSVPRIVGPRAGRAESGRPASVARSTDAGDVARRPHRGTAAPASRPPLGAPPGAPSRPTRASPVAGSSRSESLPTAKASGRPGPFRRVTEALEAASLRGGSRVRLRLSPAHLGELSIEVTLSGSRLQARVRTQTGEARDLLLAHLDELRRDLAGRGIRIGRFDIDVCDRTSEAPPEEAPRLRSHRRQVLDLDA